MNNFEVPFDNAVQLFSSSVTGAVAAIIYVLLVVAAWKIFNKAGYPGILALIPIVNVIILIKIAGYSGWLVLLYIIPVVNVIFAIVVAVKLGQRFEKNAFFSLIFLWIFPIIGYFILGFGSARYSPAAQ